MKDQVSYRRFADTPGLVLGDACLSGQAFEPHYHLDYHIGVVDYGVQAQRFRGATHLLSPGHVAFMPPGEVHDGTGNEEGFRLKTFRLAPEVLHPLCLDITGRSGQPTLGGVILGDALLAAQLGQLHGELQQSATPVTLGFQSGLLEVVARLLAGSKDCRPEAIRGGLGDMQCQRVRDYCMAHLAEQITLEDLAALCAMSRFQFLRRFRVNFGVTPHNWLVRLRLERACRLLATGGRTIAELAQEVGFYDQSHFTRAFRAAFGVAPTRY
jgi:AraC-like DNA-binding protein